MYQFNVGDKTFEIETGVGDELLGKCLRKDNTWEPWQLALYRRILSPGDICFDIGANIGTSCLAMEYYGGKVFAFEPVPGTFDLLEKNLVLNKSTAIEAFKLGISNERATHNILVTSSMLANAHEVPAGAFVPEGSVVYPMSVLPLDAWRGENKTSLPALIKVDVEGYELEVLEGGRECFSSPEAVTIIEFAVTAQRTAGLTQFPERPKDVAFFKALQEIYSHIFLIGRCGRLFRVSNYAQLRIAMMRGTPTDDLLCCHHIPDTIADLIDDLAFPGTMTSEFVVRSGCTITVLNHDEDGWARALPELGAVSALVVTASEPSAIEVSFAPIHQQHLDVPIRPVLIAQGDDVSFCDTKIELQLQRGVNWILIESQNAFEAASYLGNPNDPRRIGFNYSLV